MRAKRSLRSPAVRQVDSFVIDCYSIHGLTFVCCLDEMQLKEIKDVAATVRSIRCLSMFVLFVFRNVCRVQIVCIRSIHCS